MKSVQLEASDEDNEGHDWAHTEVTMMFSSGSLVDFTFFLVTIPKLWIKFSSVLNTKASWVELIGFLAPDARWVKIAGIEFLEVFGAFSGVFLLPVLQIVLHVGFFFKGCRLFDLVEGIKESLALFLGPHVHDHEEYEGPDWLGENASLLLLGGNLSLGSESFTGKSTLPPAHEADTNGKKGDWVKLF